MPQSQGAGFSGQVVAEEHAGRAPSLGRRRPGGRPGGAVPRGAVPRGPARDRGGGVGRDAAVGGPRGRGGAQGGGRDDGGGDPGFGGFGADQGRGGAREREAGLRPGADGPRGEERAGEAAAEGLLRRRSVAKGRLGGPARAPAPPRQGRGGRGPRAMDRVAPRGLRRRAGRRLERRGRRELRVRAASDGCRGAARAVGRRGGGAPRRRRRRRGGTDDEDARGAALRRVGAPLGPRDGAHAIVQRPIRGHVAAAARGGRRLRRVARRRLLRRRLRRPRDGRPGLRRCRPVDRPERLPRLARRVAQPRAARERGDSTSLQRTRSNSRETKHLRSGVAPRDDRSSKDEPDGVENDRETRS